MKYEILSQLEIKKMLGYSENNNANFNRIIARQAKNNIIITFSKKEGCKKFYNVEIPEKQELQIPDGFIFKKEIKGLDNLAKELNYTYDSIKTNFKIMVERQLKNFDRLIIKTQDIHFNNIYFIYEKPSEKNQDLDGEEWKDCVFNNDLLISNKGRIKIKKDGFITYGSLDNQGYYVYGSINEKGQRMRVHREVLKAFQPIENDDNYFVDHINGKRNDNRLENLRWVYPEQNNQFSDENNTKIHTEIAHLIQKYGYENTLNKLKNLA